MSGFDSDYEEPDFLTEKIDDSSETNNETDGFAKFWFGDKNQERRVEKEPEPKYGEEYSRPRYIEEVDHMTYPMQDCGKFIL